MSSFLFFLPCSKSDSSYGPSQSRNLDSLGADSTRVLARSVDVEGWGSSWLLKLQPSCWMRKLLGEFRFILLKGCWGCSLQSPSDLNVHAPYAAPTGCLVRLSGAARPRLLDPGLSGKSGAMALRPFLQLSLRGTQPNKKTSKATAPSKHTLPRNVGRHVGVAQCSPHPPSCFSKRRA